MDLSRAEDRLLVADMVVGWPPREEKGLQASDLAEGVTRVIRSPSGPMFWGLCGGRLPFSLGVDGQTQPQALDTYLTCQPG